MKKGFPKKENSSRKRESHPKKFELKVLLPQYMAVFLIILPALISALYIKLYGVNICFWDQWELIPLIKKLHNGSLSVTDLFAQHNEHRIFFPRLLMLLLSDLTRYNNKAEMYVGWLFLCLIAFVFWRIYKLCFGQHSPPTAFILISWLVFSLRQRENLLWGWQIQIFMSVFFFLLALYTLEKSKRLDFHFVVPVLSGIVSSFSFASGLFVWPIGFLQLLWQHKFKQKTFKSNYAKLLLLWTATSIITYAIYFTGYTNPAHHPSLFFFLHHPISSALYFLAAIGSPLAIEKYTGVAMGLLLLCLYTCIGLLAAKRTAAQSFLPLALILFALLSAGILVFARSGFGVEQGFSSRYTTITMLGVAGFYLLVLSVSLEGEKKRFLFGFLLSLIFLGVIALCLNGIKSGINTRYIHRMDAYYLQTYRFQADKQLKHLYPKPEIVRERAQILEKYGLNVFSEHRVEPQNLIFVSYPALGRIEAINGQPPETQIPFVAVNASQENSITITGWAVDGRAKDKAGGVFINVDGLLDIPAFYGLGRRDVAEYFKNKRYRFSGFTASFATSVLGKGRHTLALKVVTADKKSYYLSKERVTLEIK